MLGKVVMCCGMNLWKGGSGFWKRGNDGDLKGCNGFLER